MDYEQWDADQKIPLMRFVVEDEHAGVDTQGAEGRGHEKELAFGDARGLGDGWFGFVKWTTSGQAREVSNEKSNQMRNQRFLKLFLEGNLEASL